MIDEKELEHIKNGIDSLKLMASETSCIAAIEMKTRDGYIVRLEVKEDDGSLDFGNERNKE